MTAVSHICGRAVCDKKNGDDKKIMLLSAFVLVLLSAVLTCGFQLPLTSSPYLPYRLPTRNQRTSSVSFRLFGVPFFNNWLMKSFPESIEAFNDSTDNLFLDMNAVIHEAARRDRSEEHAKSMLVHKVLHLFHSLKPRKLLYVAMDGVAPRAKLANQLASRRDNIKKAMHSELKDSMDKNAISPATPFMRDISTQLTQALRREIEQNDWSRGTVIVMTDSCVPGEGEHKLMAYLRDHCTHHPEDINVIYGGDADLVMLSLLSDVPNCKIVGSHLFNQENNGTYTSLAWDMDKLKRSLFRRYFEDPAHYYRMRQSSPSFDSNDTEITTEAEYLQDHSWLRPSNAVSHEEFQRRVIHDLAFLTMFLGNDFLPKISGMSVYTSSHEWLCRCYFHALPQMKGFITEISRLDKPTIDASSSGSVPAPPVSLRKRRVRLHLARLELYLQEVARRERLYVVTPAHSPRTDANSESDTNEESIDEVDSSDIAERIRHSDAASPVGANSTELPAANTSMQVSVDTVSSSVPPISSTDTTVFRRPRLSVALQTQPKRDDISSKEFQQEQNGRELHPGDTIAITMDNPDPKQLYYYEKLHYWANSTAVRGVVHSFLRGLAWVLNYYVNGPLDWTWYYDHSCAPLLSDMQNLSDLSLRFGNDDPPPALEQLFAIIPRESCRILPDPCWSHLISTHESLTFAERIQLANAAVGNFRASLLTTPLSGPLSNCSLEDLESLQAMLQPGQPLFIVPQEVRASDLVPAPPLTDSANLPKNSQQVWQKQRRWRPTFYKR